MKKQQNKIYLKNFYLLLMSLFLVNVTLTPNSSKAQLSTQASNIEETIEENKPFKAKKWRVGITGEPPAVIVSEDSSNLRKRLTGISIELWDELATALNLKYELIYNDSVTQTLEKLANQEIDIAMGGITVTKNNIRRFDFTQPVHEDKISVLVPLQSPTLWTIIQPFFGWAFLSSIILIGLCLFIVGNLLWLAEHRYNSEQFPKNYFRGVREGVWCALTTFSTVGYGDRYPVTNLGRFIAGSWMLISLAAVTTLTAGIATTLALAFSAQPSQNLQSPSDLKGVRLVTISGSKAVQWGQYYQGRMVEVDNLSDGIQQLESNQVDGVLHSRLALEYYLYENPQAPFRVVNFDIGTQNYSIALTQDHPLTEKLNEQILSIEMKLRFEKIKDTWFKSQLNK
ncbi:transporter substrate-binding domain-containing protein [Crocosphaera sp.]|uniref:transporter substrate-binding domain-containing protein n=1 Tax=Crocosphaera sp. TaxID=2729996 RepID=UPI003F264F79|nr:transporter substrate-binding domain-containing protein [Crocosphaera sp.]